MKNSRKVIFHIDLNQFYCSVAKIKNPRLEGKAFAIGRENTLKGVIATASYEARAYGINSGMSLVDAYNKLQSLIVVDYPHELYKTYSEKFFNLLREYQKDIEQTSIDEGYLDVTSITKDINRHPLDLAKEIQMRALKELKLPCSIGIAPTLFLAKMGSDLKKPLGITFINESDIKTKLYPLKVKEIHGIGKKTYPRLMDAGILTIRDFMDPKNKELVLSIVGENTYNHQVLNLTGKSNDIVDPYRYKDSESFSHSTTFDTPLITLDEVTLEILNLCDSIHLELIHKKKLCRTVSITLRDKEFVTITRSKTLPKATDDKTVLNYYIEELILDNYDNRPLRLVGATYSNLCSKEELDLEVNLFNYDDVYGKVEAIKKLMKDFDDRYKDMPLFFGKDLENKLKPKPKRDLFHLDIEE